MRSSDFTFDRYVGKAGYSSTDVWDFFTGKAKKGFKIVGVIESRKLTIRPRTDGYAIMLEAENGEWVWLHVPLD